MKGEQLALHTDKYEINMMYAHWFQGTHRQMSVFEVYFRRLPFGNGYAVFAGLERVIEYIQNLKFSEEEIRYLRSQEEAYDEGFFEELRQFRFSGNLYSVHEGTLVFPNQPLIRVEAPIFEAQLIETALLNFVNYQTLIATKAARMKQAAPEDTFLEFGTRRAQEADAAVWGSRSAYIAGFDATSNMRAGMLFGIPTKGTHAHSWVQGHDREEEAFEKYAEALPDQVTLLVDTYDTLKSGVPHAVHIAKQLEKRGKQMRAIRIDSGDLAYLSKQARAMLDEAGLQYVRIVASNDLDENIIHHLKTQGARIDIWGVGTHLITGGDEPALGGVYKLVARETSEGYKPVIKISGNPEKVVTPGIKEPYRLISCETGKALADYIAFLDEEEIKRGANITLSDPAYPYLSRTLDNYKSTPLLQSVFHMGNLVYEQPSLEQSRVYHRDQLKLFSPEHLRKLNPEKYPVILSKKVWSLKSKMIRQYGLHK